MGPFGIASGVQFGLLIYMFIGGIGTLIEAESCQDSKTYSATAFAAHVSIWPAYAAGVFMGKSVPKLQCVPAPTK